MNARAPDLPSHGVSPRGSAAGPHRMYPGLVTVRWLAARCEVSAGTVYTWIERGTVTATRLAWTWRMWGPNLARELADEHDVGTFTVRTPRSGPAGYVDTATVAAWLGVSEGSARQMARSGVLPSVRVGPAFRFHWPSLLEVFVAGRSFGAEHGDRLVVDSTHRVDAP